MILLKKIVRLFFEEFCSLLNLLKYKLTGQEYIRVKYFKAVLNWGDILNVYLIEKVTGKKVLHHPLGYKKHLLGIGSVIASANRNTVIWGAGLMHESQSPKSAPDYICSVRGPKTKARLENLGIDVPDIYGDPCIILGRIYKPKPVDSKRFKLGIIPHYVDKENQHLKKLLSHKDVTMVDIQQDIEPFIDQINNCDFIASSSLHGMIASDTYKIPNCRLIFGDKVVGGRFKFDDYHLGIGCDEYTTVTVNEGTTIESILDSCKLKEIDEHLVDKLIALASSDKVNNL